MKRFFAPLLLLIITSDGFAMNSSSIDASSLLRLINSGQTPVIVDVRSEREFNEGHIPGAIHIPFWAMYFRSNEVPGDVLSLVIIYCHSGSRASLATWLLEVEGFRNVRHLDGHMSNWREKGFPIETDHVAQPL